MSLVEKTSNQVEWHHPYYSSSKVLVRLYSEQSNTIYIEHFFHNMKDDKRYVYNTALYKFVEENIQNYGLIPDDQYTNIFKEAWNKKDTLTSEQITLISPFIYENSQLIQRNLYTIGDTDSDSDDEDPYYRGNIEEFIRGC